MRLYKFKPASSLLHLLDIVVHERLYCSRYADLNDPFEGQFKSLVGAINFFSGPAASEMGHVLRQIEQRRSSNPRVLYRDLQEVPGIGEPKVCSLSGTMNDVRMWSLYAESHQGVAIEIDFTGIEDSARMVQYESSLPKFGSSLLTGGPTAVEVLTCKSDQWRYEQEYRIVQEDAYFPIEGRVKRVIVGSRASDGLKELLLKLVPREIDLVLARLNYDGVRVEEGIILPRSEPRQPMQQEVGNV